LYLGGVKFVVISVHVAFNFNEKATLIEIISEIVTLDYVAVQVELLSVLTREPLVFLDKLHSPVVGFGHLDLLFEALAN